MRFVFQASLSTLWVWVKAKTIKDFHMKAAEQSTKRKRDSYRTLRQAIYIYIYITLRAEKDVYLSLYLDGQFG